jgi:tagaturonate reductase
MEQLSFQTLQKIGYKGYIKKAAPIKALQFGEGNFLRAFVEDFLDQANERADWNGKVAVVQPTPRGRKTDIINAQDGLYTLYLRGSEKGCKVDEKRVISSVACCINPYRDYDSFLEAACSPDLEFITSNTTEAGIVYDPEAKPTDTPCLSFPGKLTQALYARYQKGLPGVVILSCELIDNNGVELRRCVNKHIDDWKLDDGFRTYVNEKNLFCNTLVDRIVPGGVKDAAESAAMDKANGYTDALKDVGECFGIWIIEGPASLRDRLPFHRAGLDKFVQIVPDVAPYKKRKVRILNGAHTGFVLGAYLAGQDIVRDCMHDETIRGFMNKMLYEEVIPTLPLDRQDLLDFAAAVSDRFNNPFVDHQLLSISLNSTSKWRARNLPSFKDSLARTGTLPVCLTMSLAAYIAFYSNDVQRREADCLVCRRAKGNEYKVQDDAAVLDFYFAHRKDAPADLVRAVLGNKDWWGEDLGAIAGLADAVTKDLELIRTKGAEQAFASCL